MLCIGLLYSCQYYLNDYKDFCLSIFRVYEHVISFCIQGFVEDQFGLGLIARAVEEGIAVIKPSGIMVFNMGGRPGQGVCQRLFERRGFRITKLWQTKIMQVVRQWDTRNNYPYQQYVLVLVC